MSNDKKIKKVKNTKYFRKSTPRHLDTGFVSLERFMSINEYDDGSISR